MNKIKLLHIQLLPILSGVQNVMIQLLLGLEPEKYDIYVLSSSNGPLAKKVVENGWTHIPLDCFVRKLSIKDIKVFFVLYKIIKEIKPDIVHTHSSKPGFIGRIVSKMCKVPMIVHTIHGFPFHNYQNIFIRFFLTTLDSIAALFADYNVFVNKFEKEIAILRLGYNMKKAVTIYNGINLYEKTKNYPIDMEKQPLNIVSVLRFTKQKNVIFTIERVVSIVKENDDVFFTFYGDGELLKRCMEIVQANNLQDRIVFKGWLNEIQDELLYYDVFLLNSLWEGLSLAILEAMSVGLPIICSNIKGNNELVDVNNGWLIDPKNKDDLSKTIQEILSDKNILPIKGHESLKKVTLQFQYELFISEYKKIYEKIFEKKLNEV